MIIEFAIIALIAICKMLLVCKVCNRKTQHIGVHFIITHYMQCFIIYLSIKSMCFFLFFSQENKKILTEAVNAGYAALDKAYSASIKKYTPVADKQGIKKITYSESDLNAFRKAAAQPVWDQWIKEANAVGLPAQELLDLVLKVAKDASK